MSKVLTFPIECIERRPERRSTDDSRARDEAERAALQQALLGRDETIRELRAINHAQRERLQGLHHRMSALKDLVQILGTELDRARKSSAHQALTAKRQLQAQAEEQEIQCALLQHLRDELEAKVGELRAGLGQSNRALDEARTKLALTERLWRRALVRGMTPRERAMMGSSIDHAALDDDDDHKNHEDDDLCTLEEATDLDALGTDTDVEVYPQFRPRAAQPPHPALKPVHLVETLPPVDEAPAVDDTITAPELVTPVPARPESRLPYYACILLKPRR